MTISPDSIVYFQWGPIVLSATIVFTWLVMALLVLISWLVTRKLDSGESISHWQSFLETIVSIIRSQIRDITNQPPDRYLPFLATLFLFI